MNLELKRELEEGNFGRAARRMEEMKEFSLEADLPLLSLVLSRKLGELAGRLSGGPGDLEVLGEMERALSLPLRPNLWRAQVSCFRLLGEYARRRAGGEDPAWVELFGRVAEKLGLRLPSPKDL
ncbi:MAG: hypothetical protein DSO04_05735 [Hadesarchaea archaeon]|nr:MAG: hypothetical protein DSO04_05735 [Hadesarchaea archaeon]